MSRPTEIQYLEPRYDCDGGLLYYMTLSSDRRHRPDFVEPENVPQPHRGAGYFECSRERRGPWMKLIPIRRVERVELG